MNTQTEVPAHDNSIPTVRSLNTDYTSNLHLKLSNKETELTKIKLDLKKLYIRFDTNPRYYQKEDYIQLLDVLSKGFLYLYSLHEETEPNAEFVNGYLTNIDFENGYIILNNLDFINSYLKLI